MIFTNSGVGGWRWEPLGTWLPVPGFLSRRIDGYESPLTMSIRSLLRAVGIRCLFTGHQKKILLYFDGPDPGGVTEVTGCARCNFLSVARKLFEHDAMGFPINGSSR